MPIRLDLANCFGLEAWLFRDHLTREPLMFSSELPLPANSRPSAKPSLASRTANGWLLFLCAFVIFPCTSLAQRPPQTSDGPSKDEIREFLAIKLPDDPAAVVAVVGKTQILAGDILPRVDSRIKEIRDQSSQKPTDEEVQYMRSRLFRSLLQQTIQLKMLRESFLLSQVGTQNAEKRAEAEVKLQSRARQMFAESELPKLYKQLGVFSVDAVDAELRKKGSSFESTKRDFIDQMLAYLYQSDQIKKDPEVALIEIQNYYEDNKSKYQFKAQVRWEQLTATFEKSGSRENVINAINEMGREAFFGGSMQAVAKANSQEPFASRGGLHEWTNRGSLASTILEDQLFKLPTGAMSEVIEDSDGMHIVRILGRREAGIKPMSELQDDIREIIKRKKTQETTERVMDEMARKVPVWTMFPDDVKGAFELAVVEPTTRIE